jgi:glycine/D-amino acid oxidase-like deaminating enzyme
MAWFMDHKPYAVSHPPSAMTRFRVRRGHSVWLPSGRSSQRYPTLHGHHDADLVVVGGGMTGALVALEFAAAGVAVCLLEAALVARGSTAASSALLLQEPDQNLAHLATRYGAAASRRIWTLSRDAVRDFVDLLRRRRVACDLVQRDALYYAPAPEAARRLHREFVARSRAGFQGEWLTAERVRRAAGIAASGAIRTTGNAQFDPYQAGLGILAAAAASGARIFERSPAIRIDARRTHVHVRTRRGSVAARRVVIATGYATRHFKPLAGRFRMYDTYVLATESLTAADRRAIGLGDVMLWDTERPYHYARWTADHRLLLGGGDRPVTPGRRRAARFTDATRQLRDDFEALFPPLAGIGIEQAWEGLFAMTPDSLPYIGAHRRYPGHLFALGYGGNGMTFGFLAARMLREQWQGVVSPDHELFRFGRLR